MHIYFYAIRFTEQTINVKGKNGKKKQLKNKKRLKNYIKCKRKKDLK